MNGRTLHEIHVLVNEILVSKRKCSYFETTQIHFLEKTLKVRNWPKRLKSDWPIDKDDLLFYWEYLYQLRGFVSEPVVVIFFRPLNGIYVLSFSWYWEVPCLFLNLHAYHGLVVYDFHGLSNFILNYHESRQFRKRIHISNCCSQLQYNWMKRKLLLRP